MLERVISGGQTGADQAGLRAARACGIPTGGWLTGAAPPPGVAWHAPDREGFPLALMSTRMRACHPPETAAAP